LTEKLKFDLEIASNNLKRALDDALIQVKKVESSTGRIKFDPIFGNQFIEGTKEATKGVETLEKQAKASSDSGISSITKYATAALGVAFGLAAIAKAGLQSFSEQETAINRLDAALKSTGQFTTATSNSLQAYASSLQTTTRFSDDAALSSLGLLQSLVKLDQAGLQRATSGAADLAARFGRDLPSVVETLGRAINGQTRGLNQFGIQFKDTGDKAKNFEGIMALVEARFSGSAQNDLATYAGQTAALGNSFDESKESIGRFLVASGAAQEVNRILGGTFDIVKNAFNQVSAAISGDESVQAYGERINILTNDLALLERQRSSPLTENNPAIKARISEINEEIAALEVLHLRQERVESQVFVRQSTANAEGGGGAPDRSQELLDQENATQAKITDARIQGETQRQLALRELEILGIEDSTLRAQAQLDFENENALIQAELKFNTQVEENQKILDEKNRALANELALEERKTAVVKANAATNKKTKEQEASDERQIFAARASALQGFLALGIALSQEGSVTAKVLATASATINTYVAASQALADPLVPTVAKPFLVAGIIATGLANVAKINSVKAFEDGGIVGGSSFSGDRVMARVNSGELILNTAQQGVIAAQLGGSGNGGGSNAPIIIQIDGREVFRAVREQIKSGARLSA